MLKNNFLCLDLVQTKIMYKIYRGTQKGEISTVSNHHLKRFLKTEADREGNLWTAVENGYRVAEFL